MTTTSHFVAVQTQNLRSPIVFGIGATADAALADARSSVESMDEITVVPCTPELAAAVERGVVECEIVNGTATVRES